METGRLLAGEGIYVAANAFDGLRNFTRGTFLCPFKEQVFDEMRAEREIGAAVGLAVGAAIGDLIGGYADYVAVVALAGLGVYVLLADEAKEEARVARFASSSGLTLIAVGLSVSLDELAIGFALGLARVPIVPALILIVVQAFVVSQIGFGLGRRIGESVREGAERLAGVALIGIAILLLLSRLGVLRV